METTRGGGAARGVGVGSGAAEPVDWHAHAIESTAMAHASLTARRAYTTRECAPVHCRHADVVCEKR